MDTETKSDFKDLDELIASKGYDELREQFRLHNSFFDIFPKPEIKAVVNEVIDETQLIDFPSKRQRRTVAKFKPSFTLKLQRKNFSADQEAHLAKLKTDEEVKTFYNNIIRDELVGPISDKLMERIKANKTAMRLLDELHINKETKTMRSCVSSLFIIEIEKKDDDENIEAYRLRDLIVKFAIFV